MRDKATKVFHMNQLLKLFPDFIFSDNRNSTSDKVFNATLVKKLMQNYSDIHSRSSVGLFRGVFLFASLQGQVDK